MILVLSKGVALGRSNSSDRPLTAAGTLDSVQILRSTQVEASSRTLRSDEPPMMAIWERADSCAVAEVQCNAASSASSLVEFKRLVGLLMFSGGFGIQQCQSHTPRLKQLPSYIFPSWVYSPPLTCLSWTCVRPFEPCILSKQLLFVQTFLLHITPPSMTTASGAVQPVLVRFLNSVSNYCESDLDGH